MDRLFEPLTKERLKLIPSDAAYEIRCLRLACTAALEYLLGVPNSDGLNRVIERLESVVSRKGSE